MQVAHLDEHEQKQISAFKEDRRRFSSLSDDEYCGGTPIVWMLIAG